MSGLAYEESKTTPFIHRGCGGTIVATLDGEICSLCGFEFDLEAHDDVPVTTDGAGGTSG